MRLDKIYVNEYEVGLDSRWHEESNEHTSAIAEHEYISKDALFTWASEKKNELLNDELTDVAAGINAGIDMMIHFINNL